MLTKTNRTYFLWAQKVKTFSCLLQGGAYLLFEQQRKFIRRLATQKCVLEFGSICDGGTSEMKHIAKNFPANLKRHFVNGNKRFQNQFVVKLATGTWQNPCFAPKLHQWDNFLIE